MPRTALPLEPDPVIEAYKKDVDRTLIRENLKLTPDGRFRKHAQILKQLRTLRRAATASRQPNTRKAA